MSGFDEEVLPVPGDVLVVLIVVQYALAKPLRFGWKWPQHGH